MALLVSLALQEIVHGGGELVHGEELLHHHLNVILYLPLVFVIKCDHITLNRDCQTASSAQF